MTTIDKVYLTLALSSFVWFIWFRRMLAHRPVLLDLLKAVTVSAICGVLTSTFLIYPGVLLFRWLRN